MDAETRAELFQVGEQLIIAGARFAALLIFMGMHSTLVMAVGWVTPSEWGKARGILEVIFWVAFLVLYADQVFEMLAVFIPRLKPLRTRLTRGSIESGGAR